MKTDAIWGARTYQEQLHKLALLRREIEKGLRDVERGRLISPDRAFAPFRKTLKKKRVKARASTRP